MTRTIPAALKAALNLNNANALPDVIEQYYAIELMLSTPLRVWTGYGDRTIDGNTYSGLGNIISIDPMIESGDMTAHGMVLGVSGLDSSIITAALTEQYQGKAATIFWGVANTTEVLNAFTGFLDVMTISDSGETAELKVSIENKMITLERAYERRYTGESHRKTIAIENYSNANDSFFNWTARGTDRQLAWGKDDAD